MWTLRTLMCSHSALWEMFIIYTPETEPLALLLDVEFHWAEFLLCLGLQLRQTK